MKPYPMQEEGDIALAEMSDAQMSDVASAFDREMSGAELSPEDQLKQEAEARVSEREAILGALGQHLQTQATERVNQRRPVEDRWLEDIRQYHSQYDPQLKAKIKEAKGSEVFVNITAPKTDGFAARMADMILPTDGKNWAIKPTPVPEAVGALHDETPIKDGPTGQPITTASGEQLQARDVAKGIVEALIRRCQDMERVMDDQLTECNFNAAQRRAIDQCSQIGTMVLKGPNIVGRSRASWRRQEDATGTIHVKEQVEDKRPAVEFVDVWDFFPDMSSPDPEGWEDVFQRHYMTKRQLRDLAKEPGFDENAIREVLKEDSRPYATALHLSLLREITGEHATLQSMSRYELWEYHGPITAEQLVACGYDMKELEDPLKVMDAVVWFCEGKVLKAVPNPSQGLGYHITWVKKDETSPFGFGIPRLMRNSQKVANAAWRMVMDNAGLSLAPQIIMAMGVEPADGNWTLYAGKVWIAKEGVVDVRYAMNAFDLPIRLKELLTIFETAMKLADEETSMPVIMQGDRSPAIPETAEGMSMLFNAASVIQRRFVRLYDDRITKPIITGLYDWNMEYHPDEDIKGDYTTVALGSSALLEKERQTQNILAALNLIQNPLIKPRVKVHGIVKAAFDALRLGEHVKDEQTADADAQKEAQAAAQAAQAERGGRPGTDPNALALKQQELAERAATRQSNERMHQETLAVSVQKLADAHSTTREKIMADLGIAKLKEDGTTARFNAELVHANNAGQGI
jgi:hypothetical protein